MQVTQYLLLLLFFLFPPSHLLVIKWQSSVKPTSPQVIKVIYPSTLQMMCAELISVIFFSSLANG